MQKFILGILIKTTMLQPTYLFNANMWQILEEKKRMHYEGMFQREFFYTTQIYLKVG